MRSSTLPLPESSRMKLRVFAAPLAALSLVAAGAGAQVVPQGNGTAKKMLTVEDYSRWRSIGGQSLSGDGKWVVYVYSQTNTAPTDAKPVMHLLNLESNQDVEVTNAS